MTKSGAVKAETTKLSVERLTGEWPAVLRDAIAIHNQTIDAANHFNTLFKEQSNDAGAENNSADAEQDLLRAMLVFSCSGLDAVVKQLVQDAIADVIDKDDGAHREFQKFVERRLKRTSGSDEKEKPAGKLASIDSSLLASVLTARDPRKELVRQLIESLTGDSLQSRDQLLRVAAHFALTRDEVISDDASLKLGFEARNQIIHEMDVDLTGKRSRRERTHKAMIKASETMLSTAEKFISATHKKLGD